MKIKIAPSQRKSTGHRSQLHHAAYQVIAGTLFVTSLLALPACADEVSDVTKLVRSGKVAEALNKTNEFLAKHPSDPQMRFMKGVLLTEQNKTAEAIAVFTKLTEEFRDLPEPYNNLAVLYASTGQYDKARIALEQAIHTNPSYLTAYENLGDVYGKMASQAYDKALELGTASSPAKSKLTLLRTFSSSTGTRLAPPDVAAPAQAANTASKLILPNAPTGKEVPVHRIPSLAAAVPAAPVAAPAAPVVVAKVAPAPVVAKPAPVLVAAPAKPAPVTLATATVKPSPAPVLVAAAPAKPAAVLLAANKPASAPVASVKPPIAPPAPISKPAADTGERDDVLDQVHGWAKAWAAQDVDGYLGFYSGDFEAPKGLSYKAWAAERRNRIAGKGRIRVEVSAPQVTINGNIAKVSFRQVYQSDRLSATSRKTLVLIKNAGKWKIKQETTGS